MFHFSLHYKISSPFCFNIKIPCHAESWNAGVETKIAVKVFWLYTKLHLWALQQGPAVSIFTDRSKWTSICSLCVDKLKKNQHKFGGFSQDFIEILRNTMGILMDFRGISNWGQKSKIVSYDMWHTLYSSPETIRITPFHKTPKFSVTTVTAAMQ